MKPYNYTITILKWYVSYGFVLKDIVLIRIEL